MSFVIPVSSGLALLATGNAIKHMGVAGLNAGNKLLREANRAPSEASAGIALGASVASTAIGTTSLVAAVPLLLLGSTSLAYGTYKFTKSICKFSDNKAIITGLVTGTLGMVISLR